MKNTTESLRRAGWAHSDRLMAGLLILHFPLALALAAWHNTWVAAILVGGGATLSMVLAAKLAPGSLVTRIVAAFALMTYSGLLIYQSGSMIEFHFHIFAALAF